MRNNTGELKMIDTTKDSLYASPNSEESMQSRLMTFLAIVAKGLHEVKNNQGEIK
jgi:hypothetical protein